MVSKVKVKCTRCGTIFIRPNYGKGRRRWRRFGKGPEKRGDNPMVFCQSHAKTTDSCLCCGGTVAPF